MRQIDHGLVEAANTQNLEEGKKILNGMQSKIESCEWGIFEWHQLLKSKWEAKRISANTQIEITLKHLDRLVKLQQARCFEPENLESDISSLLLQIQQEQIIEFPKSNSLQLDEVIEKFREKSNHERVNSSIAERKVEFYDSLSDQSNRAICHMALCHFFTVIFATSTLNKETLKQENSNSIQGNLFEIIDDILHLPISLHKIHVPLATLLSKLVTAWGALDSNIHSFVTKESSLTELFSEEFAFQFLSSFEFQLNLLSMEGSYYFAEAVFIRVLVLVANGFIDLTRPIIEQLITKLALTISPGHSKPVDGKTSIILNGSSCLVTLTFPTHVYLNQYRNAKLEEYKDFFLNQNLQALSQEMKDFPCFYLESEILVRSGWEVIPDIPSNSYLLQYPKLSLLPELGHRKATSKMLTFLLEMGWYVNTQAVPQEINIEKQNLNDSTLLSSSSNQIPVSDDGNKKLEISDDEWNEMKDQVQSQRQLIIQQTSALNHLSQLVKSLQQQLQSEKTLRTEMQTQLQSILDSTQKPSAPQPIVASHNEFSDRNVADDPFVALPSTYDLPPPSFPALMQPSHAPPSVPVYQEEEEEELSDSETPSASWEE